MSEHPHELRFMPADSDQEMTATLELIARARQSLAEARELPDIRRVIEVASVATDAARRAARLADAQHAAVEIVDAANEAANDAAAVRIEAQAKAGELLRQMAESGERKARGDAMSQPVTSLDDLGVGRMDAHRWQQVAAIPPEDRQEYVDTAKAAKEEVSTAGLLRHGQAPRSVDHAAIAADARKRMRVVYRGLGELPGYRPEALVAALDNAERRDLLRTLRRLPAWIDELMKELAIFRVSEEG